MHRLTFPLTSLEPVLSGSKPCTIRFSAVAKRIKVGDTVTLAFGAYHKPTVLLAAAARVDHFDLTEQLEQMRQVDAELDSLTAEEEAEMDAAEEIMQGWTPTYRLSAVLPLGRRTGGAVRRARQHGRRL